MDPYKASVLRQIELLQELLKFEASKETREYYEKQLDWLQQQLKIMQEGEL